MMLGNTTSRCQALADKYGEAARWSYWVLAVADLARLASELLTRPERAPKTAALLAQWPTAASGFYPLLMLSIRKHGDRFPG